VRCSVLQCVAVCCSVLQCVAVCCSALQGIPVRCRVSIDVIQSTHSSTHIYCVFLTYWHFVGAILGVWCFVHRGRFAMFSRHICCVSLVNVCVICVVSPVWHSCVCTGLVSLCCSVLQCVAVCCSVLQCVICVESPLRHSCVCTDSVSCFFVAVCCSVLQCVAVCWTYLLYLPCECVCHMCRVSRITTLCVCTGLVSLCCSVLQCVAVSPLWMCVPYVSCLPYNDTVCVWWAPQGIVTNDSVCAITLCVYSLCLVSLYCSVLQCVVVCCSIL